MTPTRRRCPVAAAVLGLVGLAVSPTRAADVFDLLDINEGELQFLSTPPKTPPHLQSTHISIHRRSLEDGWISTKQCHYNLAAVSAMQVVFPAKRVRNLEILGSEKIGRAWVEGPTVQLTDIGADGSICLRSDNRTLKRNSLDGTFEWHGGPYMRRFLDGYFPMHVKIAIDYPSAALRLNTIEPSALKLRSVMQPGHVRIDAMFEGRLDVVLHFQPMQTSPGVGWQ